MFLLGAYVKTQGMLCDYLLHEIHNIVAKICDKSSPASLPTSRTGQPSSGLKLTKSSSVDSTLSFAQSSTQVSHSHGSSLSSQAEMLPAAVLNGVNSFFSVASGTPSPSYFSTPGPSSPVSSHRGGSTASKRERGIDSQGGSIRSALQASDNSDTGSVGSRDADKDGNTLKRGSSGTSASDGANVTEQTEIEMLTEIIYLLRPLLYIVHHNSVLLIDGTPKLLHLSVTLLSLGKAILMPHVHVLISSLVYTMVACSSGIDSSIHTSVDSSSRLSLMLRSVPNMSSSSLVLPSTNRPQKHLYPPQSDETSSALDGEEEDMKQTASSEPNEPNTPFSSAPDEAEFAAMCTPGSIMLWKSVLHEFNSDAFQLIFKKAPTLTPNNFERVAHAVASIVQESTSVLCVRWRRSMWNLALNSARKTTYSSQYSPFFLMVGSLIQNDMNVSDTYVCLSDVFGALINVTDVCIKHHFNEHDEPLLRPVLFCLSKFIPLMDTNDIQELFWFAVLLLVVFPTSYLSGPVTLVNHIVVELLERIESGNGGFIEQNLLQSRQSSKQLNRIFRRIEKEGHIISGVSFESSFSMALASLLLRGFQMTEAKTRDMTEETLRLLMEHYQRQSESPGDSSGSGGGIGTSRKCISGYAAVLLTVWGDISLVSQPQLSIQHDNSDAGDIRFSVSPPPTSMSGTPGGILEQPRAKTTLSVLTASARPMMSTLPEDPIYRPTQQLQRQRSSSAALLPDKPPTYAHVSFFGEHNFPTNKSLVLFVTMLLACIRTLQNMEEEQLFVHKLLLQTIRELPSVLTILYDIIFSDMSAAYATSLNNDSALHRVLFDIINECLMSGFSRQQFSVRPRAVECAGPQSELDDANVHDSRSPTAADAETYSPKLSHSPLHGTPSGGEMGLTNASRTELGVGAGAGDTTTEDNRGDRARKGSESPADAGREGGAAGANTGGGNVDVPFARGSVQSMGDGIDSDDDDSTGGFGYAASTIYLAELGFSGLLEGAHTYALGTSVVRGRCVCVGQDGNREASDKMCRSCAARKTAKHLVSVGKFSQ